LKSIINSKIENKSATTTVVSVIMGYAAMFAAIN
jgi:hypothetical protein